MTLGELEVFVRDNDCRLMLSVLGGEFIVMVSRKGFEIGRAKARTLEGAITFAVKEASVNGARRAGGSNG